MSSRVQHETDPGGGPILKSPSGPGSDESGSRAKGRLLSDGAWLAAGQVLTASATLVGVRLLTESVPPDVYGSVTLILGLLLLGRNLFCFPFYQAALRFFPELARRGEVWRLRRVVFSYLVRSSSWLVVLIVLLGLPYCLARSLPVRLVPLLIGLLYVDIFRTMETDLLNAARRQRAFSILRAVEAWARPLAAVLMVRLLGADPTSVMLGYLVASGGVLASIFATGMERVGAGEGPVAGRDKLGDRELNERLWRFSLPLVPLSLLEWISTLSDRYLIGGLIGLEAAGVYAAAYGLVTQPFLISQALLEMLYRPVYFEALAIGDVERGRRIFRTWMALTATVCAIGFVAITLLREPLTSLLLAERYRSASALLPWIAAGSFMFAISLVAEKLFHASHRTELVLFSRVVGAVLSLVAGIPMIIAFGPLGAAAAVPIYYGAQLLICLWQASMIRSG